MTDLNIELGQKVESVADKDGKLTVVILSEEFEGQKYRMRFQQKHGKTALVHLDSVGEYTPKGDPGWVPARFFNPAISQARAIFTDHRARERKKQKPGQGQGTVSI